MIGPVEQFLSTRPGTPNFIGAATSGFTNDLDNLDLPHTKTFVMPSLHAPDLTFLLSLDLALRPAKTNDSSWSSPPTCPGAPPYGIPHLSSRGGTSSCSSVVRSVCYNPTIDTVADSSRKRKRRSGKDDDCSDDDDDSFAPASAAPTASDRHLSRREGIRRQRLEMEQSRRDELRDSCLRLKDALPVSNSISKGLLLDRATDHIKSLELRVQQAENEAARLRKLNEMLMLSTAEKHHSTATVVASSRLPAILETPSCGPMKTGAHPQ